ncbi:RNA pyrophosphohydrolase [Colletotrichum liriopes]|uniref:RNA pyrophosphohydrolase n=1 Tax=Colletotrichum liriopes TaxID=708192 RepID=A0AA37GZ76_9PEZI|nr:RNA pyrophosphohydrolase [Colletotrichum liriopes]
MPLREYSEEAKMGTMGILVKEGKVLLIYRRLKTKEIRINGPPDTWSFPGGGVEENETPEDAIRREMKEEVGLEVEIQTIGGESVWGETDDYLDIKWRCFFFVLRQVDPKEEAKIMEPHKHVGYMWITWDELWVKIEADMADGTKEDTSGKVIMRFFLSMQNMVKKYPNRSDAACLEKRL